MTQTLLRLGGLFLGFLFLSVSGIGQVKVDENEKRIWLKEHAQLLTDSTNTLGFGEIQSRSASFSPLSKTQLPLSPHQTHWLHIEIENPKPYATEWMLFNPSVGFASLYVVDSTGNHVVFHSGRNRPAREKVANEGDFIHFPLKLDAESSYALYLKLWEIDHQPIPVALSLRDMLSWRAESHIPLEKIVIFFLGIFGIMMLYNLVLFITIRFDAYLYYALYLLCVGTFVLFAVGPMTHPSFGNPRWLVPIGHLAFGAINIFYYLFGKSFLNLKELLPTWDKILNWAIGIKTACLIFAQAELYTVFNLPLALNIEFSLLLLDVLLNLVFFIALLRTRNRLAYYFIGGAGSVIVLGLSLAVLGHLFAIPHTFIIFLSSIVVEIIFFSLGLGYRIRQTEKAKVNAEREKRLAQEALNEQLSSINIAFKRFVPHEFIRSLGHQSVLDVNLGDGVEKEVTVLFSDIRDYTTMSEKMTPKENFDFLNTYLGRMGPAIQQYKGFVNQYYGDGIMALFPHSPEDALEAAGAMMETLEDFNHFRSKDKKLPIRIGIGMHTGRLMMGVIGDEDRMDAGVVADAVNTAARMEGLTKYYGTPVLFSDKTLSGIPQGHDYPIRFLGKVQVKGKAQAVDVHEYKANLRGEQQAKYKEMAYVFGNGLAAYYRQDFKQAKHNFQAALALHPNDKTAQMYLDRAENYQLNGVPINWTGVELM